MDIRQALQQKRVECSALTVQDHLHGFFVGEGFFIAAFAGQRIVYIGQRNQLCADGNFIRHILELIQGEIEYSGAPLFEVFGKTANRVQEPYRSWMLDLQRRVEARGGQSFRGIWEACTDTKLKELHLKSRHMRELSEVGMYLGQMDVRTGRTSMQMYLENLGAEIEETRQEITAKKRIGNWLGVMSGLFLVIVLF